MTIAAAELEARQQPEQNRADEHRSAYEKDSCRLIHSFAFRRLQGKLQVITADISDFHRNRMTHSLEVASIAKSIFHALRAKYANQALPILQTPYTDHHDSLLFTLGLAHDIGHPPFGHAGEHVLDQMMREYGGFEGNAQSLWILTTSQEDRFNLCRRTLLGILKYPNRYSVLANPDQSEPPKCYYDQSQAVVDFLLAAFSREDQQTFQAFDQQGRTQHKTFDCSMMDLADDIAYSLHDLEDAIFLKQVTREQCDQLATVLKQQFSDQAETILNNIFGSDKLKRKDSFGFLVHHVIKQITIQQKKQFQATLLDYNAQFDQDTIALIQSIKKVVVQHVIGSAPVQSAVNQGKQVVRELFDLLLSNQTLLPKSRQALIQQGDSPMRVVCDYIAGMTDQYALQLHQRNNEC